MSAIVLGVAALALYLRGVVLYGRRFPARAFSFWRIAAFTAGTTLMVIALSPPVDALADTWFAVHMLQHVTLMLVGPPLILLGAPLLLMVAVPPPRFARRLTAFADSAVGQVIFAPLTGWLSLVGVLWFSHFSPLYEAALVYPAVHVVEHVLFIGAAFLFWGAIVQVGYAPRPVPFPARILFLFLAIPQGAFLGLAIYAARGVLYPHYLERHTSAVALADQQNGGAVMWIMGGFLLFAALMATCAAWAAAERGAEAGS
jgi:cytochrome c oxidase assembly factor CtaG